MAAARAYTLPSHAFPADRQSTFAFAVAGIVALGAQLAIFSLLIGASTLGYNGWGHSRIFSGPSYAHARSALMLGVALHLLAAHFTLPYFRIAHGASIRDMFTPMLWLFLIIMSFAVVLPLALQAKTRGNNVGVILACLVLGFSPLATSISLYSWAKNLRQFTLAH